MRRRFVPSLDMLPSRISPTTFTAPTYPCDPSSTSTTPTSSPTTTSSPPVTSSSPSTIS